jgi:hypothetical protein
MHQLGRLVPIIPVITKADTMTINEAQRFRQEVAGRLQVRARAFGGFRPAGYLPAVCCALALGGAGLLEGGGGFCLLPFCAYTPSMPPAILLLETKPP